MIANKMEEQLAKSSLIREMFEEGKRLANIHGPENVFDLSLGNPNVAPPSSIKESIIEIINETDPNALHGYMSNSGHEDVRQAVAQYENQTKGISIDKDNVVMTCGAAGGLNIILKTFLNPGDEVITFAPFFAEYRNYVGNYNGELVVVPADTKTYQPNLEELPKYITEKTKVVLVNSPNNPSGVVYSEETIIKLAGILKNKEEELGINIILVSDEPYREIVYDGVKVPYILNYYHNTIVGYSFSKSLSLPGERIGYLVINPKMKDLDKVVPSINICNRTLGFVNAPSLFQKVIAKNLYASVDIEYYKRNRDLLYNHLLELGFNCVKPEGAFYLFMKTPIDDDVEFCKIAKEFNLLLVPGSAFGCKSHVRLCYCVSYETIERSLPAFEKLWNRFK